MVNGGYLVFGKGQNIIQILERFVPKSLALEGDKIGLQVGSLNKEIKKILLTLDVLENVVDEAIEKDIDLIISHHAVIFKPLKNLSTDVAQGKLLEKLIKNDIAVYVAHSNLDVVENGVNDVLAEKIGITYTDYLEIIHSEKLKKIVVYVPEDYHHSVFNAMTSNGAGWIGNYSNCSFNVTGTGTFMPMEGTNPYLGSQGKLEKVTEVRIETVVPEEKLRQVVQAMLKAHPYEEVAYDIYPLDIMGEKFGLGRVGKIEEPMKLNNFAQYIKERLNLDSVRVVGDLDKSVQKVAIIGGDGNDYIMKAVFKGADVLVTGDIYYHVAHEAMAQGLAIIDAGHNIEKYVLDNIKAFLDREFSIKGIETEVIISKVNTNPFKFL